MKQASFVEPSRGEPVITRFNTTLEEHVCLVELLRYRVVAIDKIRKVSR
jgi:hypothetical protein